MSEVKTYCPTWRASVGSTMIESDLRLSQPELYVDYHDYKAAKYSPPTDDGWIEWHGGER